MPHLQPFYNGRSFPRMHEMGGRKEHGRNGELSTDIIIDNTVENLRESGVHKVVLPS